MALFLYNIFIVIYTAGIRAYSLLNPKARLWIKGRRRILRRIQQELSNNTQPVVWMHCASLGEFEQGRPVLEAIKQEGKYKVVLTFFSPSGYENAKNYPNADHIFYLPIDTPYRAKRFIDTLNPSLVLWVKYEYWYHILTELKKRSIPTLLISGIFREDQAFFKWYGGIWRKMLPCFSHFFVQTEASKLLVESLGYNNVSISGDTRFDRVITIAENFSPIPVIQQFCEGHRVIVAGSTWEDDEAELSHFVKANPDIRFIIAPHEIDAENLKDVHQLFPQAVFFSEYNAEPNRFSDKNCMIIDNIGMLSRLYKYADICYVGGGFGNDGVHNVLEAAVYGKPVMYGPVYDKYIEAEELIECGGGIVINNALELEKEITTLLQSDVELKQCGENAAEYVRKNAGATRKIIDHIYANRLLIN